MVRAVPISIFNSIRDRSFDVRLRAHAAGMHLAISISLAVAIAALVFGLWFPWPYRIVAGGQELFLLIVGVDVVMGPLLTFTVFNKSKCRRHLTRDLVIIGSMQLVALGYGVHATYVARPVALVFEIDRFRVISAAKVYLPELNQARPEYRSLPLTRRWLLGTRPMRDGKEHDEALFMGIEGVDLAQRPIFWQPYIQSRANALARSRPVDLLAQRYPARKAELESVIHELHLTPDNARFLPLTSRKDWVVILNPIGDVTGFAAFDGFF